MIKTRCIKCRKEIEYGKSYCDSCTSKKIKEDKKFNRVDTKVADKLLKTGMWSSLREKILLRDNGMCVLCFRRGYIEQHRLEVHHIIKRTVCLEKAFDADNLVTVCKTCHEELEKLTPKEQRELLGDFNKVIDYPLL